jgi:hypothetical protein
MSLLRYAQYPERRHIGLTQSTIADGCLIHATLEDAVHILQPEVMSVWRLADGKRSLEQIAYASQLDHDSVRAALHALAEADLLLSSDIVAVAYRDFRVADREVPLIRTHHHGAAWLAGYRRGLADTSDSPSPDRSFGTPWDGTREAC